MRIRKILCKIGIHNWFEIYVKSKLPIQHAKGWQELGNRNEFIYRKGRKCSCCQKEQYRVFHGLLSGSEYYNTIR